MALLRFAAATTVSFDIPLVDDQGNLVTATTAILTIFDEADTAVRAPATIDLTGLTEYVVTLAPTETQLIADTTLTAMATRGLRRVQIIALGDRGTVTINQDILLEAPTRLVVPTNTFVTYGQAQMIAWDTPNLDGWNAADEEPRLTALIDAWYSLARLRYRMQLEADQSRIIYPWSELDLIRLKLTYFYTADYRFKLAITRAQVMQADYLLGNDPIAAARRSGLMSTRVGESNDFFRQTKPYEGPVCERAFREISKYVDRSVRIGRA